MKNYNLLSFLFLIWLIIKKINSKIENIFLKNTNQQNDDEYETINLEPYKIERIIYEESFYFKYDCNTSCNDVYFSIDKGNEYGTGIYIYDDYKNIKKTDKALFTFITGINIRKNELLHFDFGEKKIIYITISSLFKKNNNNLNYFYMFHNSGKIINVNSYLEKNLCYKINKGGNLLPDADMHNITEIRDLSEPKVRILIFLSPIFAIVVFPTPSIPSIETIIFYHYFLKYSFKILYSTL